ncbi:MAG: hypothetical protein GC136_00990 [Alphaproteobacteria bacterium]|nr:hypothetical protein [Alphaproteobacteria bacterium]
MRFNSTNLAVYKEKVFVIADKQTKNTSVRLWENLLSSPQKQLKVLNKNGIEYYYPERILQSIFNCKKSRDTIVEGYLRSKPNEFNNIRLSKIELSKKVVELLDTNDMNEKNNEFLDFLKTI